MVRVTWYLQTRKLPRNFLSTDHLWFPRPTAWFLISPSHYLFIYDLLWDHKIFYHFFFIFLSHSHKSYHIIKSSTLLSFILTMAHVDVDYLGLAWLKKKKKKKKKKKRKRRKKERVVFSLFISFILYSNLKFKYRKNHLFS